MGGLIADLPEWPTPQRVLDEWMEKVGPSRANATLPRYWFWNGTKHYASYEDYVDD